MNINLEISPATLTDRQLVARHLDGDREAFRCIVERHQAMVCALGLSACGDVARSEDIAQEVFIVAWKQLPELREPEKLRGWLAGITRNLIHNSFRGQRRTPTARAEELSAELPSEGISPRDQAIGADEASLMWQALEGIPENYREPMVLFYREQRSVTAVAAVLEISEEAVRQRLVRGRAMLTERMAKLVEETLERSAPTPAFAGVVLLALPSLLGPTVVETTLGAGGTVAKTASAAGGIATVAAKGGLVVKTVSALALLPALLNGLEDFIRFRIRHRVVATEAERRRMAWSYLITQAATGAAVLGIFVVPNGLLRRDGSSWRYELLGLGIIVALAIIGWAKRRVNHGVPVEEPVLSGKATETSTPGFEYRTGKTLLGLPLFHVRLGSKRGWRLPVVKAWVAVSDGRSVGALFASGPAALAPLSLGVGSVGMLSLGGFSIGVWTAGGVAAGYLSEGIVAAGWKAAKGGFVVARQFAEGWAPHALHVNDAGAAAFFREHWFDQFATFAKTGALWAGFMGWVVPLILMSWHLWRTRAPQP